MNEKMMKRTVYEAPVTELFRIELEAGVCAASGEKVVINDNTEVTIERQGGFDEGDITVGEWE